MPSDQALTDLLLKLETSLFLPQTRKSSEALADLLANDMIEFGSSGKVYSKEAIIDALTEERTDQFSIAQFQVAALASDVALTTYRLSRQSKSSGLTTQSLRSSIWRMSTGRWKLVFHQGTPIPTE